MTKRDDLGREPEETHDKDFAPVNRGADERGRTVGEERDGAEVSGTGVPGVRTADSDALPADEEGVRYAEEHDATRPHP